MPLYLVRWPGLVAAFINAADEDDLQDVLDETANPEGCTWSEYDGPLNIEFALNASVKIEDDERDDDRPLAPDQVKISDVSKLCERDVMRAEIPADSDTAIDMVEAILESAFPAVHKLWKSDRETLPEAKVRAALGEELSALVQASWRHEQTKRRADPDSRMAAQMGTSPRLIAHWQKKGREAEARARPTPGPKKPSKSKKPPKPKK